MQTRHYASRRRRLASMAYEMFLLGAIAVVGGFILVPIVQGLPEPVRKPTLQFGVLLMAGMYCVPSWARGRTLAMKTWGITVIRADGALPGSAAAFKRFLWAVPSVGLLGLGLLWSLVDRDKQFLHDRLAGTRLVDADRSATLVPADQPDTDGEKKEGGQ